MFSDDMIFCIPEVQGGVVCNANTFDWKEHIHRRKHETDVERLHTPSGCSDFTLQVTEAT